MNIQKIRFGAKCELARRDLFEYCHLTAADFYRRDRQFLADLCRELQEFIESDGTVCVVNAPPRHGKSRTAGKLVEWVLGNDHSQKIMTGSYNETLSTTFAKNVRNTIQEVKVDDSRIVFTDVFPHTRIKRGDGSMNLWSLEDGYNNYLATSPTGTATGFGASLMIIDDLIKNAEEARNENVKEKQWDWYTNTMLSRLEEGGKVLIIMTRWTSDDLAGRALEFYERQGIKVRHINLKANIEGKKMLCPDILSYASYKLKCASMGEDIASANYQQEPIDLKGCLYTEFKTYDVIPTNDEGFPLFTGIYSYTDTADAGSDYLCSFIWGVYNREVYILDALYTQEPMQITERKAAEMHTLHKVNLARIESNNGGSGWARSVKRICKEELHNYTTVFKWFHQGKNKQARILSNATWVMEHIYYPKYWRDKWPDLYRDLTKYQREGKNAHDDAPDALTGVAETMQRKGC